MALAFPYECDGKAQLLGSCSPMPGEAGNLSLLTTLTSPRLSSVHISFACPKLRERKMTCLELRR